jgi:hypothetical protein
MDPDVQAVKLSKTTAKRLFFNADTKETDALFAHAQRQEVHEPEAIVPEEKPVDPFAAVNERNAIMNAARAEAAKVSDPTQTLVEGPHRPANSSETVTLDQLPLIVRQAAENAIQKRGLVAHLGRRGPGGRPRIGQPAGQPLRDPLKV